MSLVRREWTPEAADEWTREDLLACVCAAGAYITLAVGAALAILLQWEGFVLLGVTAVLIWLMVYIIDPKLRAVSAEYEKRQQAYLKELDQITRWEA